MPHLVPALVEAAAIVVPVLRLGLKRRMGAGIGQLQEERPGRVRCLLGADVADRPVGEVVGDVVVVPRRGLHRGQAVIEGAGAEIVGGVALVPVGPLEPAVGGPVVERAGGAVVRHVVHVPLAHQEGGPAGVPQHLGQGRGLQGQVAPIARIAGIDVRQPPHARRVVVQAGEQRRPGAGAHGRGAEVGIAQPLRRQGVHARRVDVAPVAAEIGIAHIVQDDQHDVRRALRRRHPVGPQGRMAVGIGQRDLRRVSRSHGGGGDEGRGRVADGSAQGGDPRHAGGAQSAPDQQGPAVEAGSGVICIRRHGPSPTKQLSLSVS